MNVRNIFNYIGKNAGSPHCKSHENWTRIHYWVSSCTYVLLHCLTNNVLSSSEAVTWYLAVITTKKRDGVLVKLDTHGSSRRLLPTLTMVIYSTTRKKWSFCLWFFTARLLDVSIKSPPNPMCSCSPLPLCSAILWTHCSRITRGRGTWNWETLTPYKGASGLHRDSTDLIETTPIN